MCTKRRGAIRCTSSVFTRTLKHFLHINILYSMLLKQIFVMDTTEKLVFSPPIKFFWTIHAVEVPITLVPVPHTKKRQQCWHKMGLQKGQYMQVLKSKMMKILPRVLWFWLLQKIWISNHLFNDRPRCVFQLPCLLENIFFGVSECLADFWQHMLHFMSKIR